MRGLVIAALLLSATPALGGIGQVAWLANCWEADGGEPGSGEQWTTPAGGQLLGMARTVRDGAVASFEFMRIVERDDGLAFIAQPNGGAPVEFSATELGETHVVFENAANDFPQRVIYRLAGPGVLHARIEGGDAAMDFQMHRVACDARTPSP